MFNVMFRWLLCLMVLAVALPAMASKQRVLNIDPVYSSVPAWTWLAVGQMVLEREGYPPVTSRNKYQCGIMSGVGSFCDQDCQVCQPSAGTRSDVVAMLRGYPALINQEKGRPYVEFRPRSLSYQLDSIEVENEILAGRPVIAMIDPDGKANGSGPHPVLIVGFRQSGSSNRMTLVVNDPYPYIEGPSGVYSNPYLANRGRPDGQGRYEIPYCYFASDSFRWYESIIDLQHE